MRRITIALAAATLASASANAQSRFSTASTTAHAIVLPVSSCISSPFGPRLLPNHPQVGTYHNGVDLPAPEGTPVRDVEWRRIRPLESRVGRITGYRLRFNLEGRPKGKAAPAKMT